MTAIDLEEPQELAHVSTHRAGKLRWTELSIWRFLDGYLLVVDGCSDAEQEDDRRRVVWADDEAELVDKLKEDGRMSYPAREALRQAAERDRPLAEERDKEEASAGADRRTRRRRQDDHGAGPGGGDRGGVPARGTADD